MLLNAVACWAETITYDINLLVLCRLSSLVLISHLNISIIRSLANRTLLTVHIGDLMKTVVVTGDGIQQLGTTLLRHSPIPFPHSPLATLKIGPKVLLDKTRKVLTRIQAARDR